jgi:hypothetical protein
VHFGCFRIQEECEIYTGKQLIESLSLGIHDVSNTTDVTLLRLLECSSKLGVTELRHISGSHGGEYGDGCFLGCRAVLSGTILQTSETSVNVYQTTQRNNPEDSHLQNCVTFRRSSRSGVGEEHLMGPSISICLSRFSYELDNPHDHGSLLHKN